MDRSWDNEKIIWLVDGEAFDSEQEAVDYCRDNDLDVEVIEWEVI